MKFVESRTSVPTVEKNLKDINDTTGETTGWQDSADYDINDSVPFQLTATLPDNLASYDDSSSFKINNLKSLNGVTSQVKPLMVAPFLVIFILIVLLLVVNVYRRLRH